MMHPFLRGVEAGKEFYAVDGARLHNLEELALFLDVIEEAVFRHHVTTERNDFSTWVRDVIRDAELADQLLRLDSPEAMARAAKQRIRELRAAGAQPRRHESMTSRAREFAFGLVLGYLIGMLVARLILG